MGWSMTIVGWTRSASQSSSKHSFKMYPGVSRPVALWTPAFRAASLAVANAASGSDMSSASKSSPGGREGTNDSKGTQSVAPETSNEDQSHEYEKQEKNEEQQKKNKKRVAKKNKRRAAKKNKKRAAKKNKKKWWRTLRSIAPHFDILCSHLAG